MNKSLSLCGKTIGIFSAFALSGSMAALAQTTVFSDNFTGSSTLNQAVSSPTSDSTSYETAVGIAGSSSSLSSGDLNLTLPSTTSVLGEVQALFTTSPITLASVGDYIDLTVTFKDTANILSSSANSSSSSLVIGLFNSGGVSPNQGTIQLNTGNTTGGTQGWKGYGARIVGTGTANVITRNSQTASGTTSQNQDLLFNNASSSQAFNSPTGVQIGTKTTSGVFLTAGNTYTLDYTITLSAAGTLSISNSLYSGSAVNPADSLFGEIATAGTTNDITSTFDGLAFGARYSGPAASAIFDISQITVVDDVAAVPEPATMALLGVGVVGLVSQLRRKNS